jgi:hypothetical protein
MEMRVRNVTIRNSPLFRLAAKLVVAAMIVASFAFSLPMSHQAMAHQLTDVPHSDAGQNHQHQQSDNHPDQQGDNALVCCEVISGSCSQYAVCLSGRLAIGRSDLGSARFVVPDDPVASRSPDIELPPPRT